MADMAPRQIHAAGGSHVPTARAVRLRNERELGRDAVALPAIADLLAAPIDEVAEHARAALDPLLPHDALVLVTPASPRFPVLIAASRGARERLARVDWEALVGEPHESGPGTDGDPVRLLLPDVVGGLRVVGWMTGSAGSRVALLLGSQRPFAIDAAQERAASEVATLAAARERGIGADPSPGTLAFSHAISQERERVRWELQSHHTVTLTALLRLLRQEGGNADASASRLTREPAIAQAIDVASRALLELRAAAKREETALHVSLKSEFAEAQTDVQTIARPSGLRTIFGLEGDDDIQVPWAIAQAARAATRAAALLAAHEAGADKLRVHWKLADDTLTIIVCDNGPGVLQPGADPVPELALMRRRIAALHGTVELDVVPEWGTALTCDLPLHDVAPAPESPATQRISELRAREREVLELMVTGLRNREIAERLFITVRTVKFHVSNILRKLEVQSRTEAIAVAHSAGISALTSPQAEPTADQL
jgi:DNA-binding CsgD family transcriptional regulator/signal transduction histidine kinase